MMHKNVVGFLTALLLSSSAFGDEAAIRKAIESLYPKVKVQSVAKTPFNGLYEVYIDGQIIYTDENFSFMLAEGRLIDPHNRRDLTAERLDELSRVDFNSLPLEQAIKVVKGNGSRKLVVFSDPDCPYCKRLEQKELIGITDITIYTFLYPLESLHPDAANKAQAIWCAPDRVKAWQDWVLNGQLPKKTATCDHPLDKVAQLGRRLGVNSTPLLIFSDGKRLAGAYPAKEIERLLNNAAAKK